MKASATMQHDMMSIVERLIPVSEFSKGKTSHIFDDVKNNNSEYIVLKNNQPTAVLISVDEYKKIKKLEAYLEQVDEKMLFDMAVSAVGCWDGKTAITMEELMKKHNIDTAEVEAAMESLEIE